MPQPYEATKAEQCRVRNALKPQKMTTEKLRVSRSAAGSRGQRSLVGVWGQRPQEERREKRRKERKEKKGEKREERGVV